MPIIAFFLRRALLRRVLRSKPYYGRRRGVGYERALIGARPSRRSNVRVTGCCLPIPLSAVAVSAVAARQVAKR